jgi:hypothetical protein
MHLLIPLMSGMHNKSQQSSRGHHGVMIKVNNTGDFSAAHEVQNFKIFQFRNGRWDLCDAHSKSQQSSWGDDH